MLLVWLVLVAASLVEGFPVKRERYQTIRCRPEDNSIACVQEQSIFDQAQQSNNIDSNPVNKRVFPFPPPVPFSAEDSSSGDGVFLGEEPGSASSSETESNEIRDYRVKYNMFEDNNIV